MRVLHKSAIESPVSYSKKLTDVIQWSVATESHCIIHRGDSTKWEKVEKIIKTEDEPVEFASCNAQYSFALWSFRESSAQNIKSWSADNVFLPIFNIFSEINQEIFFFQETQIKLDKKKIMSNIITHKTSCLLVISFINQVLW